MNTINPEKLAAFDDLTLHHGSHPSFEAGHCAMEVVAWLADLGHTDAPACASPVLARYVIRLNDRWDDEQRQTLKPYLPRMVGTGGDGKDELREQIAARWISQRLLGPWLRLAGLDAEADALETASDVPAVRRAIRDARVAAWRIRSERYDLIRAKVRELLAEKPAAADAAAAAVTVAVTVADAAAAAVTDAVTVAAADADAVTVAAAAAVAAADADAVAVTVADAVADGSDYWTVRNAAYRAARAYYDAHPLPIGQEITDLAASQKDAALELLDALIDPAVER